MRGPEEASTIGRDDDFEGSVPDRKLDVAPSRAGRSGRGHGERAIQIRYVVRPAAGVSQHLCREIVEERHRHIVARELERKVERLTWHVCEIL